MVDAFQTVLPQSAVHHIGMYNNKSVSLLPVLYFNKLPAHSGADVVLILEPQIATAGTVRATVDLIKEWGGKKSQGCGVLM